MSSSKAYRNSNESRCSNLTLSISTDSEVEANRMLHALATKGYITMPQDKAFWLYWWTSSASIGG